MRCFEVPQEGAKTYVWILKIRLDPKEMSLRKPLRLHDGKPLRNPSVLPLRNQSPPGGSPLTGAFKKLLPSG